MANPLQWRSPAGETIGDRVVLLFEHGHSDERGLLSNVTCHAIKPTASGMPRQERVEAAREILKWSMNGDNQTERELLGRWETRLHDALSEHRTG